MTTHSVALTPLEQYDAEAGPTISLVMPCLNEAEALPWCIDQARKALVALGETFEIVVGDNGSTDGSVEIALKRGVKLVRAERRGYGCAYHAAIAAARGRWIVMVDSDGSYDFGDIPALIGLLREGNDLAMGSRLKGDIEPGAMPWLHRYVGNPVLSGFLRQLYRTSVSDTQCGFRAFTREAYDRMHLRCPGMEYASEMVINAGKAGLAIDEVPIRYHPRKGQSKLQSFSDGWRHLRYMLMFSPTHLYLLPGASLVAIGLVMLLALLGGPLQVGGHAYDYHFMILASMLAILGYQIISLGLFAKAYFRVHGPFRGDPLIRGFLAHFTLERGLKVAGVLFVLGVAANSFVLVKWVATNFGSLDEVRMAVMGLTLTVLGVQTAFSAFLLSFLQNALPVED
ncbi:MAG: glycosyltransferase [Candidatus Schekmanbacteria bacterium]|nr:glycosyltransferase [Candidatus Schekmanbacteria bacterium]